jgi:hypothetical protein
MEFEEIKPYKPTFSFKIPDVKFEHPPCYEENCMLCAFVAVPIVLITLPPKPIRYYPGYYPGLKNR